MPKVSIITPAHGDISQKVDWLDEMIQSVVSQTLTDWELIIIDDKSPLSLSSIVAKYENEPRIRRTTQGAFFENARNDGPAMTRNTAVGLAETECILPLDADDMLANNETLEYMYDAWIMDTTKIIYGNLQMYTQSDSNVFKRGRIIQLGEYTFELAMNLGGIMPVTAMHSKECHYQAGGWKPELKPGLEDVEYWIASGERGFCGQKIGHTTLVYRRQENSRAYKLKHVNQEFRTMQDKIKAMHSDIYAGRFPVACCGKSVVDPDPIVTSQSVSSEYIKIITPLEGYDENQLEWVAYRGPKKASFGSILTSKPVNTPNQYKMEGFGHLFQIHKSHHKLFSDRQHLGFEMNQPDPRERPEPEPELIVAPQVTPQVTEMPKPKMSTIVRMDTIASQTRKADVQLIQEPAITFSHDKVTMPGKSAVKFGSTDDFMQEDTFFGPDESEASIRDLGLSDSLTKLLIDNAVTIEWLIHEAKPEQLTVLSGIGIKRANTIIAKAKELIGK